MKSSAESASNGLRELNEADPTFHDTGGIRPFGRIVGNLLFSAALSAGALGGTGFESTTPQVPESFTVSSVSSRLRARRTAGQQYVQDRLVAMRERSVEPAVLDEYPTYPTADVIDMAQSLLEKLISETTPTPSVVPGDGGWVEFIWSKSGWDLMFAVSDERTEVWAKHELTGRIEACGSRPEDHLQFGEILASLSIG